MAEPASAPAVLNPHRLGIGLNPLDPAVKTGARLAPDSRAGMRIVQRFEMVDRIVRDYTDLYAALTGGVA